MKMSQIPSARVWKRAEGTGCSGCELNIWYPYPEPSVIVMDNASYHCRVEKKNPNHSMEEKRHSRFFGAEGA